MQQGRPVLQIEHLFEFFWTLKVVIAETLSALELTREFSSFFVVCCCLITLNHLILSILARFETAFSSPDCGFLNSL